MERVKVPARVREDMSKRRIKELRRLGFVPACISGKDGSTPLEIRLKDLASATRTAGIHGLIDIEVENHKKAGGTAIIKEIQKDPVTRKVLHIDLQKVSLREKIVAPVPVEFVGTSRGEKEGGILEHVLTEVEVRALPTDLPPKIEIDASDWDIGHVTRAGDLPMPSGVELVTDPEDVIATLRPPHVHVVEKPGEVPEEAAAPAAEAAKAEPEAEEKET